MNIKKLILFSFLIFKIKSTAQTQKYAIACDSFTINSKVSNYAVDIRRIFEITISKNEFPFTFVEKDQDKINNIFTLLKNEKISKENIGKKQPDIDFLGLDYLVSGDIKSSDNFDSKTHKIYIQFTSVSGQKGDKIFTYIFL